MDLEWASDDSLVGMSDERQDNVFVFGSRKLKFSSLDRLRHVVVQDVQRAVDVLDVLDAVDVKPTTAQSDAVDADVAQGLARGFYVRGDVLPHQRSACDEGVLANAHELLDAHHAFNDDVVFNDHVSGDVA